MAASGAHVTCRRAPLSWQRHGTSEGAGGHVAPSKECPPCVSVTGSVWSRRSVSWRLGYDRSSPLSMLEWKFSLLEKVRSPRLLLKCPEAMVNWSS